MVKILLGFMCALFVTVGLSSNFMFLFFAFVPVVLILYQTGVEIDFENKRLRDISGMLGSSKKEWQDISDAQYLGMVNSNEGRAVSAYRPSSSVRLGKTDVNLFLDGYHLHIFTGNGQKATEIADTIAHHLGIEINDARKE
ncbi:hypothetical protein GC194_07020 [bacterium]|nr:hypothetical protein [bacterium]